MVKTIAAFVEDFAHQKVIGALIDRVAAEQGILRGLATLTHIKNFIIIKPFKIF